MDLKSNSKLTLFLYTPILIIVLFFIFVVYRQVNTVTDIVNIETIRVIDKQEQYFINSEINYRVTGDKFAPCLAEVSKFVINKATGQSFYASTANSDIGVGPFEFESSLVIPYSPEITDGVYRIKLLINYPYCDGAVTERGESDDINLLSQNDIIINAPERNNAPDAPESTQSTQTIIAPRPSVIIQPVPPIELEQPREVIKETIIRENVTKETNVQNNSSESTTSTNAERPNTQPDPEPTNEPGLIGGLLENLF